MSDPNYAHEFVPNREGRCRVIIGSRICAEPESAAVHQRAVIIRTYSKPEYNPDHPWGRACDRLRAKDIPRDAEIMCEAKIGPDCRIAFLLGFLFASEMNKEGKGG